MKNNKYITGIAIALAIVLAFLVGIAVGGNTSQSLELGAAHANRFPSGYIDTGYGYYVDGTAVIDSSKNITASIFTQGGGIITVSTTSAAYTLTQTELESGNVISIADTGVAALTLTLPATSTMTTLISTAGDSREWFIENLHTAAATTTTVATGAGIELQAIANTDDVIDGAGWGKLKCYRQASTDVVCIVNEFVAAD